MTTSLIALTAIILLTIAILGFIFASQDLVMLIIYLELILLSLGLLFVYYGFLFDDLVGPLMTLIILPLAGAESALALALLVVYYPLRGRISEN